MTKSLAFYVPFIFFLLISRFFLLSSNPPSLNWDEISHGYNAYSLLQTGKDQWGQSWPIFNFRAYGDYPTTLYMYLSLPFVALFGPNAFSIRLVSSLFGIASVILIGLFIRKLTGSKFLFRSTLLLALTSPYLIYTSRAVYQSTPALFLYLLSIYLFLKPKTFSWGLLPLTLSLFAYHNTRLIALPTFVLFLWHYRHQLRFRSLLLPLLSFVIVSLLAYYQLIFGPASSRARWVGIITPATVNSIEVARNSSLLPDPLPRLIHNRPVYFTTTLVANYLSFLNPLPLFFTGSAHHHFNLPNFGLFYPILLPFFYLGLFRAAIFRTPTHKLLWLLFFLSLTPAALTSGDFPSLRLSTAIPFYFLFIALGLDIVADISKRQLSNNLFILALILFTSVFVYRYFVVFPRQYALSWQDGYSQLISALKTEYSQYDQIYITKKYGEPHQFVLFYWPYPPARYQTKPNLNWDYHADWYWVNSFDKFVFYNDWETLILRPGSLLVTASPLSSDSGLKLTHTVKSTNGLPVFYLYEN